jgi:hypothetical protein
LSLRLVRRRVDGRSAASSMVSPCFERDTRTADQLHRSLPAPNECQWSLVV